jgi:hypothetical protein
MARSKKRVPGFSQSEGGSVKAYYLRLMNRRMRRLDEAEENEWVPDGNFYRRFVCRWDYRDYNFRYFSRRELSESWYGKDGKSYLATRK